MIYCRGAIILGLVGNRIFTLGVIALMQTTVNVTQSVAVRVQNISVILSSMNNSSESSLNLLNEDMTSLELDVLFFEDFVYTIEIIRSVSKNITS
jgi:hypothetical protein